MAETSQPPHIQCDFANHSKILCGRSTHYVDEENITVPLYMCHKDTDVHLQRVNCTSKWHFPESMLILYRSGLFDISSATLSLRICQAHRDHYGIYWKRTKTICAFPDHPLHSKYKADRGASVQSCKEYWILTRQTLPVGTGLCKTCSTKLREGTGRVNIEEEIDICLQTQYELNKEEDSQISAYSDPNTHAVSVTGTQEEETDTEMAMQESDIFSCGTGITALSQQSSLDWLQTQTSPREKLNIAMQQLTNDFEPVECVLSKPWNELSKSTKSYYINKGKECVSIILQILAPGQEETLLSNIIKESNTSEDMKTTKTVVEAYNNVSDSRTKTQILSVIVNNHTKAELQKLIPGLSVHKIDCAREHARTSGAGHEVNPPKIYRVRLTKPQVQHFIEFIMSPIYSSIVGFGQTVLKLSSNEKIKIPKVIRNVINARIICTYQRYCSEMEFKALSRASLFRILKVCKASKQKALQGLDNITALGMSAIESVLKLVSKMEAFGLSGQKSKHLCDLLHIVNQFLKYEYKSHLNRLDGCGDHCTTLALSDPSNDKFATSCDHSHNEVCEKCSMVDTLVCLIRGELSELQIPDTILEELVYELDSAERNIIDWKKHLLRTIHQDLAKKNILDNLSSNQALIIMDWAMKFLPFQFRETQTEFFGKRGISWHVSCVITRSEDNQLELQCYIHILENGTQGWFSIANILTNLLKHLKAVKPELQYAFLKSDNAACYHCTNLLSFIQINNSSFPICILEYNYSEAQSGKDLCDSKTGSSRLQAYKYANEGHNIVNPRDLKAALDSHGGMKGLQVCVVSIDQSQEPKTRVKISGVSSLSNFNFETDIITARKAYQLGIGQSLTNIKDPNLSVENVYRMEIVESFPQNQPVCGKLSVGQMVTSTGNNDPQDDPDPNDHGEEITPQDTCNMNQTSYFCCPEPSCKRTFAKSHNLEKRVAVGNHVFESDKQCGLDIAARIYSEQSESLKNYQEKLYDASKPDTATGHSDARKQGWALKTRRVATRFSENVKKYLQSICLSCEQTGTRPDFVALSEEIRKVTNENGEKLFQRSEWLSPTQIRGCFAYFLSKAKNTDVHVQEPKRQKSDLELQEVLPQEDEKLSEVLNMLDTNSFTESVSAVVNNVLSEVNM